jgi:hypothetical protein
MGEAEFRPLELSSLEASPVADGAEAGCPVDSPPASLHWKMKKLGISRPE